MRILQKALITVLLVIFFSADAHAALSAARNTDCRWTGRTKRHLMTASETVYAGSLVMIDSAGTALAAAASVGNQGVCGVAQETVTSHATIATYIKVTDGAICKFAGDTLQQDDVGVLVYAQDDQTVDETASANEPPAGVLIQYVSASVAWIHVATEHTFARISVTADPMTLTGDLTLAGGQGAATFTDSASSIVVPANDATALLIGPAAMPGLITIDSQTGADEVNIVATTSTSVFRVDTGFATFDEEAVFTAGSTNSGPIVSDANAADAITLTGAAPTMTIIDNEAAAFVIKSSGTPATWMIFDTQTGAEEISINGTTGTSAFRVDLGFATFDEAAVFSAGAGAITLTSTDASLLLIDNDASAWDVGAAGTTNMMRFITTDTLEIVEFTTGVKAVALSVTGVVTLDAADCGKTMLVADAADGDDITLPATIAGCMLNFMFVGSDGGALIDLSPNASDAIHGTCVEMTGDAAIEANGTDDNDWGLTKNTSNTGDAISLIGDGGEGWYIQNCSGIWANN